MLFMEDTLSMTKMPRGEGGVLEFTLANDLRVGNTWFRRVSKLATYNSRDHHIQVDSTAETLAVLSNMSKSTQVS